MHTLLATTLELSEWLWPVLQWLGLPSLVGFLGIWGALLSFPPDVVVDATDDVSPKFNSTSRFRLKNLGMLPALDLKTHGRKLNITLGGFAMDDCAMGYGPSVSSRLAKGETTTIPILDFVGMKIPSDSTFSRFSMILRVEYSTRLIFFSKSFVKEWSVDLLPRPDGYSWTIKNRRAEQVVAPNGP